MADYSSIKGNRVQYLTSDPTLDSNSEGQVWYNSTTGSLKGLVQIKAWSSGGNLGTARRAFDGGSGTQTAALIAGGQGPALPTYNSATEEYSGYAWSAGGNLNTARSELAAAGTQTSTVAFAGEVAGVGVTSVTEEYNGSSWTNSNPVNTARRQIASSGTQTAALMFAGAEPAASNKTESYDGTSWTALPGTTNIARASFGGDGTQTAAMAVGGPSTTTEKWDGTSWSNDASLNRTIDGSNIYVGTTSHGITTGGREPPGTTLVSATEEYDSVSFSQTSATLSTARRELSGAGNGTSALAFGGYNNSTVLANTEEYFSDIANYSASSQAAWASGGNLNNNSQSRAGFGTQTEAVAGPGVGPGGGSPPGIQVTEEYNGTSWTNGNNSTRTDDENRYCAGAGTPTAGAIASGGYPGTMTAATEEYDGTSWTSGGTMSTARRGYVFDGAVVTSSLVFGGNTQPYPGSTTVTGATEHYDGTSWTSGGTMGTARTNGAGSSGGSQTSSLSTGGTQPALTSNTEEYNGTSWTEVNNQPTAVGYQGYAGTQTDCLVWNGYTPTAVTTTYNYDGTSWSSNPASLSLARLNYHNNSGTASSAIVFGGEGPAGTVTTTEEFTGVGVRETKTLTTS